MASKTKRGNQQTDNTAVVLKHRLRDHFIAKTHRCDLCFDLFAGTGLCSKIYSEHFDQVVAVDERRAQLEQFPDLQNCVTYQGDNYKLLPWLMDRYGSPAFVDLDAYGNPDACLQFVLRFCKCPVTIVVTDGTSQARRRAQVTPPAWKMRGVYWSALSIRWQEWPTLIHTHLHDWAEEQGKRVTDWRYVTPLSRAHSQGDPPVYYGAVIQERAE